MKVIRFGLLGIIGVTVIACGGGNESQPAPATPSTPIGSKAAGVSPKADITIVDWPAEERADLDAAMRSGIAALHYAGDGVKTLKCMGDGNYDFAGMSRKDDVVQMTTSDEITANLPAFGASLAKKLDVELKKGTSLDLAMVTVGRLSASKASIKRADLKGDCNDATHWVKRAHVGAFSMKTGSKGQRRPVGDVFATNNNTAVSMQDGSIDACANASPDSKTPPAQCSSPLRLELAPVE